MNIESVLQILHMRLSKRKKLQKEISKTYFEHQRLMHKYRRDLTLRNHLVMCLLVMSERSLIKNPRAVWSYERSGQWWSCIVPLLTEKQFKNNFRIQRSTFNSLVIKIGPLLQKHNTTYRLAIPVEKRIACAIYTLGSSSELRTISNLFGIGLSTVTLVLYEFCDIMIQLFMCKLIRFPSTNAEIRTTIDGFLAKCNYPLCLGSLDGTHIPIKPPVGTEPDYFNYKKFYSVIMLACVNSDLMFTYINIGAPGRCNDSSVYTRSTLYDVIEDSIYKKYFMYESGIKICAHLIADSAFGLSSTLLKPYPDRANMPRNEAYFNYRLSRARCCVERAFGTMKNRFRSIHRKLEYELNNSIKIIKTVAILHNICILAGDNPEVDWEIPDIIVKKPGANIQTSAGHDSRDALSDFFFKNPL